MEPRIQYAKTADGVSVAFWTMGQGMPLVHMPMELCMSHIGIEWRVPDIRRWYECLAERRMVIRYDPRGTGLSDRDILPTSWEANLVDLQTVADRTGSQRFALFAPWTCALVAAAYAARYTERVSHLILWCGFQRFSDNMASTRMRAFEALLQVDWKAATETWARIMVGDADDARAHAAAAFLRVSISLEAFRTGIDLFRDVDVSPLLPLIRVPTLILWRRQIPGWDVERVARELASTIPDARLTMLEGTLTAPWDDMDPVLSAINEFLGEGEEATARALPKEDVHTILFTDIESSTTLTQRLGDAKAQDLIRTHNTIVRDALKGHGGSEIKHTGDGIMASFPSASKALQCAISIQQGVAALADTPLRVRVGLNAGEPVVEEQDLFGTAVQLARRVCDHADPGQILVSDVVRQLAMGKGFLFSDQGDVELRGFEDPVRLYEVRWEA